ncbi:hypothetical protein [Pseudoduganella sp. UC29_71]|uniref:hypothetical protein n=1 Tax=Pseudoduganella sp. UC29_71 TaxID=3350174 RepID=UPI00366D6AA8
MIAPKKAQALKAARKAGMERAELWLQSDEAPVHARTAAAWRAIGYADAVMGYEQTPYFMELMEEWEKGFDAVIAPLAADTESPILAGSPVDHSGIEHDVDIPAARLGLAFRGGADNPHFQNAERAPYELGHLLMALPMDFGVSTAAEEADLQKAAAARLHADNADRTILSGIEAIGQLMEMVGGQAEEKVSSHTLLSLGDLLRHMAVEAQFVRETSDNLTYCLSLHDQRQSARKPGGDHAR